MENIIRSRKKLISAVKSTVKVATGVWLLLLLVPAPKAHAVLSDTFVAGTCASWTSPYCGGGNPFGIESVTVSIDPANTNWVAWHNTSTPANVGGKDYVGQYSWIAVDDYFALTVTNPLGNHMTLTMDWNDSMGTSSGPQAVIYGTAADAPDVERWNLSGIHKTFDEAGAFNSVFTVSGDYTFDFKFYNAHSYSYSRPDVYLLVDTNAAAVPEPSTLLLLGSGLAGAALLRKRLRR